MINPLIFFLLTSEMAFEITGIDFFCLSSRIEQIDLVKLPTSLAIRK